MYDFRFCSGAKSKLQSITRLHEQLFLLKSHCGVKLEAELWRKARDIYVAIALTDSLDDLDAIADVQKTVPKAENGCCFSTIFTVYAIVFEFLHLVGHYHVLYYWVISIDIYVR